MPNYFIYTRKSSESEDRQVLSIDSQIRELQEHAREHNLGIVNVLSESRSAKAPGRPIFSRMLREITRGKADGILCWKLDRLARNPVDGGSLIWALEENRVRDIVTPQRAFTNNGNDKFWMQLEFGMAKKYVDDLSDNVKRGNRAKLEQGWLPGPPPLGYLNDRPTKTIVKDPERFPLVRKMWDLLLSGERPPRILDIANHQWGFRTRVYKRIGGKPLTRSAIYRIFGNPFYYGLIVRAGEVHEGAHEPMIAKDQFDATQRILGRPERPRPKKHEWAYTGLIRCGECGAAVTAEHKVNRYGSRYVYYHCTKRKTDVSCRQGTVRLERLEKQIVDTLERIHLNDAIRAWALDHIAVVREQDRESGAASRRSLREAYAAGERKLTQLTDLRLRGLIGDDEFTAKRQELLSEKLKLKQQLDQLTHDGDGWFELSARALLFANLAKKRFQEATNDEKRQILLALGSNFSLRDGILRIELQKPFELIAQRRDNRHWLALNQLMLGFVS